MLIVLVSIIVFIIIIVIIYYIRPNSSTQPVNTSSTQQTQKSNTYTLTSNYTSSVYQMCNDTILSQSYYNRQYTTNGTGDGIFYEVNPVNTEYPTAILVIQTLATDYYTTFVDNAKPGDAIPSSLSITTPVYVGVVVLYSGKNMTASDILPDIVAPCANNSNWYGFFDLTKIIANATMQGFNISSIGVANTSLIPTINGNPSAYINFQNSNTIANWPFSSYSPGLRPHIPAPITTITGYGLTLTGNKLSTNDI